MKEQEVRSPSRRRFFRTAGLGAGALGGAAVALAAGKSEAAEASRAGKAGYRETSHVKRYYELAKF